MKNGKDSIHVDITSGTIKFTEKLKELDLLKNELE